MSDSIDLEPAAKHNQVDSAVQGDISMAGASTDPMVSSPETLTKVPKTHTVMAPYLSMISHTRKNAKRQARRLKKDERACIALKELSKSESNQSHATTLEQLDRSLDAHRQYGPHVSAFENKRRHLKEKIVQERRKKVAYQKVTAHERRVVIEAARKRDGKIMNKSFCEVDIIMYLQYTL